MLRSKSETVDEEDLARSRYEKIMKSAPHDQKLKAYKAMSKDNPGLPYYICPKCKRVGQTRYRKTPHMRKRIAEGKDCPLGFGKNPEKNKHEGYEEPIPYVYHYSKDDGRDYCSLEEYYRQKKKDEPKMVLCPKCHKKGIYSKKTEVHGRYSLGTCVQSYEAKRVVVRHGSRICHINKKELEQLREKYEFVKDKKTVVAVTAKSDKGMSNFGKSRSSSKLTGFEKMELKIKIYEGHKRAKEAGKRIEYDVDKKLKDAKIKMYWARLTNNPKILEDKILSPDMQEKFDKAGYYGLRKKLRGGKTMYANG